MQLGTNSNCVVIIRATTAPVGIDARAQIFLGEFGRQMQRLGVDKFAVARRIDVHRQRREQDRAENDRDDAGDDQRPAQLRLQDGAVR